jgi:hypothetical protein
MGQPRDKYSTKRRFPRARGPFDALHLGTRTPVLVYDLNLGGGFVNFGGEEPSGVAFMLKVALPGEGVIILRAETVYRHESGVAVRFVDMDADTCQRLARTIDADPTTPTSLAWC